MKLTQGEQTLDIIAVNVSADQIDLQVWLMDEERHWRLWDRLRDYMESQKLFSLKGVHFTVDTMDTICPDGQMDSSHSEQNGRDSGKQIPRENEQEDKELSTIDQIPDVGNNQLILFVASRAHRQRNWPAHSPATENDSQFAFNLAAGIR